MDGKLGEYPLPELLVDVLRGNLTGQLSLSLGKEPRNAIYFKDGVPVSVQVPDLGVSVAQLLAESGDLPGEQVADIQRQAGEFNLSESQVIVEEKILSSGALLLARRRRAREEVVRLFDLTRTSFTFREGTALPGNAALTILQPLPIVFEGLLRARDRAYLERFLDTHVGARFRLGVTYPRGVDPFEWGPETEATIEQVLAEQRSLDDLIAAGVQRVVALAALSTLSLAGMLEVYRPRTASLRGSSRAAGEADLPAAPPPGEVGSGAPVAAACSGSRSSTQGAEVLESGPVERDTAALVVHRRGPSERTPRSQSRGAPLGAPDAAARRSVAQAGEDAGPGGAAFERQLSKVSERLGALRGRSYYRVLRVTDAAPAEQIERAFRQLARQAEEGSDDPAGTQALREAYREAFEVLTDPVDARRYRELADRTRNPPATTERHAFEAGQKLLRATGALIDGRIAEAAYLVEWAAMLEPGRRDLRSFRGLVRLFHGGTGQRSGDVLIVKTAIVQDCQRSPEDLGLHLCLALVLALEGDMEGAEQVIAGCERADHPVARHVRERLSTWGP